MYDQSTKKFSFSVLLKALCNAANSHLSNINMYDKFIKMCFINYRGTDEFDILQSRYKVLQSENVQSRKVFSFDMLLIIYYSSCKSVLCVAISFYA